MVVAQERAAQAIGHQAPEQLQSEWIPDNADPCPTALCILPPDLKVGAGFALFQLELNQLPIGLMVFLCPEIDLRAERKQGSITLERRAAFRHTGGRYDFAECCNRYAPLNVFRRCTEQMPLVPPCRLLVSPYHSA